MNMLYSHQENIGEILFFILIKFYLIKKTVQCCVCQIRIVILGQDIFSPDQS
jgi:hypothetical protein